MGSKHFTNCATSLAPGPFYSSEFSLASGYKIGLYLILPTVPLGVFYPELFLVHFLAQALG